MIIWLIILSITIILIITRKNKDNLNETDQKINSTEIICLYNIKVIENKIQILGNNFKNNTVIDILINGTKIPYSESIIFNSIGIFEIKYKIY